MADPELKRVRFNTYVTRNLFKLLAEKQGCTQLYLGKELDDPATAFVFRRDGYFVSSIDNTEWSTICLTDIPQFELMPTKEAFLEYLFAWCPDGH